jgi:hypothetical protein
MTDDLRRLAREAAPDVLAAALERARERAAARLTDLLTDAIVAEALAVPAPDAREGDALYAYGITLAGLPLPDGTPGSPTAPGSSGWPPATWPCWSAR